MFVINERETFPIVRKLSDPADSATYYVRAVVRNAVSGATLNTVNLTNDGNGIQRFVGTFSAPADPSGQGFYVDIVTKVYSDSGYTTQDTTYSDEVETYLVGQRYNHNLGNGGGFGGGPDIDYKKIRKIVEEVVATVDIPKPEKMEMKDYSSELVELKKLVTREIEFPKYPEVSLGPVLSSLEKLSSNLEDFKKLYSDDDTLESLGSSLSDDVKKLSEKVNDKSEFEKYFQELGKRLEEFIAKSEFKTSFRVSLDTPMHQEEERKGHNRTKLVESLL